MKPAEFYRTVGHETCLSSGQLTKAHSSGTIGRSEILAWTVFPAVDRRGASAASATMVFAVRSAGGPGGPRRPPSIHCCGKAKQKNYEPSFFKQIR